MGGATNTYPFKSVMTEGQDVVGLCFVSRGVGSAVCTWANKLVFLGPCLECVVLNLIDC